MDEASEVQAVGWFRHDNRMRHDPKIRALNDQAYRLWNALMEMASEQRLQGIVQFLPGVPFNEEQLADEAKVPVSAIRPGLEQLKQYRMIEERPDCLFVINFAKHQYQSDTSAERTKAWRQRQQSQKQDGDGDVTSQKRHSDNEVTPPDTDTDTDTNTDKDKDTVVETTTTDCITPKRVAELWNEICGHVLPKVEKVTKGRVDHIKARLKDKERHSEEWWRDYFGRYPETPFLIGESKNGWKATFDFAIESEEKVTKVLEGVYDRSKAQASFNTAKEKTSTVFLQREKKDEKYYNHVYKPFSDSEQP